jgi:hypothetical protein
LQLSRNIFGAKLGIRGFYAIFNHDICNAISEIIFCLWSLFFSLVGVKYSYKIID